LAIVGNRFFNDAAIGQGVANIADMFKPPSGSDTYGYAKAAAEKAQAERIAQLYREAPDHEGRSIIADLFDPSQSFTAVNTDAQTKLKIAELQEAGSFARQFAQPVLVNEGQTAFLPAQTAAATSLAPMFTGNISADPGEQITTPDGRMIAGAPKPLTETEWKATQGERLRDSGQLVDADILAAINSDIPVETTVGPTGPQITRRSDSWGRQPAATPSAPTELAQLQSERRTLAAASPDDPRIREYDQRIAALGRGSGQDEYSKNVDKGMAERNFAIQDAAGAAQQKIATLDYLGQLLSTPNLDTGAGAEARLALRKGLQAIGIDVGDVGSAEALRAAANRFALELRNPEGGAGMPGALSDRDREFLVSMVPGLLNTPDGNRQILEFTKKVAQRSVDIEKMRQDYVQKHGRIDENFIAEVATFGRANPLFGDGQTTEGAGAPTDGFKILRIE